jgi:hypothetical protein
LSHSGSREALSPQRVIPKDRCQFCYPAEKPLWGIWLPTTSPVDSGPYSHLLLKTSQNFSEAGRKCFPLAQTSYVPAMARPLRQSCSEGNCRLRTWSDKAGGLNRAPRGRPRPQLQLHSVSRTCTFHISPFPVSRLISLEYAYDGTKRLSLCSAGARVLGKDQVVSDLD